MLRLLVLFILFTEYLPAVLQRRLLLFIIAEFVVYVSGKSIGEILLTHPVIGVIVRVEVMLTDCFGSCAVIVYVLEMSREIK